MTEKAVKSEIQRLKGILKNAGVPEQKQATLETVIFQLAVQRLKLEETAQQIYAEGVVCEYNNGNGQQGTHENPLFRGYNSLWKSYLAGLAAYTAVLPKETKEEVTGTSATVLELVKSKKAKAKA